MNSILDIATPRPLSRPLPARFSYPDPYPDPDQPSLFHPDPYPDRRGRGRGGPVGDLVGAGSITSYYQKLQPIHITDFFFQKFLKKSQSKITKIIVSRFLQIICTFGIIPNTRAN